MKFEVPYKNGMRVAFPVQKILKAWEAILSSPSLGLCATQTQTRRIHECGLLKVLRTRNKAFFPRRQQYCFRNGKSARPVLSAVLPLAFNFEERVDAAFRFLAAFMMAKPKFVITNVHIFTLPHNSLNERSPIEATTIPKV